MAILLYFCVKAGPVPAVKYFTFILRSYPASYVYFGFPLVCILVLTLGLKPEFNGIPLLGNSLGPGYFLSADVFGLNVCFFTFTL